MSVETLTVLIEHHGPSLFLALGFAEFIGIPVATVPALIVGGALAGLADGADPVLMVVAASAGGWIADATLFTVTRWKGSAMVDAACGLTSNPGWIFASQVQPVLFWIGRYLRWVIPMAVALVGSATLWRLWRVRLHTRLHREHRRG